MTLAVMETCTTLIITQKVQTSMQYTCWFLCTTLGKNEDTLMGNKLKKNKSCANDWRN